MSSARQGRARQSTLTLIGALGASLAIVFIVVLVTVRPANTERADVDWSAVWSTTDPALGLANPEFDAADGDWWSNRAEYVGGEYPQWYIGFVTPTDGFVVVEQFQGEPSPEIAAQLDDVPPTSRSIAGVTWAVFDRTAVTNPGNRETILLLTGPTAKGSLMVSGSAPVAEMELVATRVIESLGGTP